MPDLRVLSFGGGVDSVAIAAMCALGELPPVDAIIMADTGNERTSTYTYLAGFFVWLQFQPVKIPVYVVRNDRAICTAWESTQDEILIPAYLKIKSDGGKGQLKRQCSHHLKVTPVRRKIRDLLGVGRRGPVGAGRVEQWIAYSYEERQRRKPSRVQYIVNKYPLVELAMTRQDCQRWLMSRGLLVPARSSCVNCPYRTLRAWQLMARFSPAEFARACAFDEQLRHRRSPDSLYLSQRLLPLRHLAASRWQSRGVAIAGD